MRMSEEEGEESGWRGRVTVAEEKGIVDAGYWEWRKNA
jgi:hypothetical protein